MTYYLYATSKVNATPTLIEVFDGLPLYFLRTLTRAFCEVRGLKYECLSSYKLSLNDNRLTSMGSQKFEEN